MPMLDITPKSIVIESTVQKPSLEVNTELPSSHFSKKLPRRF